MLCLVYHMRTETEIIIIFYKMLILGYIKDYVRIMFMANNL